MAPKTCTTTSVNTKKPASIKRKENNPPSTPKRKDNTKTLQAPASVSKSVKKRKLHAAHSGVPIPLGMKKMYERRMKEQQRLEQQAEKEKLQECTSSK